jgi:dTDP-4-amino-4,6-dideoxygalactose transaminase
VTVTVIPLSRPPVDDEIKQAVLAAIDSRQYILGPQCREFEAELARYVGVRHGVLTSSATAGLWLTLRALGVKAGDEILVPSHTAFPTIEAICFAEATPVFVDADAYYTMDPDDAAAKASPRTVGLLPVHLYGQPVDLDAVRELASRLGVWVVEDCAQAHGAAWRGRKVGAWGRAAVFSFYPSKNLTVMGDGGAIVTDDDEIAARARRLRDHGRLSKDVHAEVGFNLRFNELQAAVGRVLLRRLDAMNDRRRALAARYDAALAGLPLTLPAERPGGRHVYHLYVIRTARRAELGAFLKARGIQTGVHYPVASHRQPAVERFAGPALPTTEGLVDEILTLPISAGHTEAEIDEVAAAVRAFFGA